MHTYVHTYIVCMHAYTHAYMHTCIHAYMYACIHAYMLAYMNTYIHAYRHTVLQLWVVPRIHMDTSSKSTTMEVTRWDILQQENTFYSKRTYSTTREHIPQQENTFYKKRTHSIVRAPCWIQRRWWWRGCTARCPSRHTLLWSTSSPVECVLLLWNMSSCYRMCY